MFSKIFSSLSFLFFRHSSISFSFCPWRGKSWQFLIPGNFLRADCSSYPPFPFVPVGPSSSSSSNLLPCLLLTQEPQSQRQKVHYRKKNLTDIRCFLAEFSVYPKLFCCNTVKNICNLLTFFKNKNKLCSMTCGRALQKEQGGL